MFEEEKPQREAPSALDVWLARGLLMVGMWFGGAGLWGLIRTAPELAKMLYELPSLLAGLLFLAGAWRMRAILRWEPDDDG
ncbi:hypothetical protein [Sandaracinobacteroides hominis]|uniref:hypothetical protein n=1 Tax=Sandaracinobacteroides hominis TaxID=2780086 RepID=UPI0018F41A04|nr:hypothetical protein [Sandaracinobacteroides hominis]